MHRVIHFEIPAEDATRATEFYGKVFGWASHEIAPGMGYYFCQASGDPGNGIDGSIMVRRDPAQPVVNTIEVESVDAACAAIEAAGGRVVVPKMAIPGMGYKAYFRDSEGNIFGIAEMDPAAA